MFVLNSLGDIHNRLKVKITKFKVQFYPHKIAKINKRSVFYTNKSITCMLKC